MEKNEVKIENPSESKENNPKISKKRRKIYTIVLGICLAVVAALFSLNVYSALNYEIGYFYDYSMAPTINKTITNEGVPYEYNNFKNEDGNIVEYGMVDTNITENSLKRFNIVVIETTTAKNFLFDAMRIVGLPGETIKIDYEGKLYVNGEEVKQPIEKSFLKIKWPDINQPISNLYYQCTLKEGEYYLLKDNRYYSSRDSRAYGPYTFADFYGKVVAIQGTCTIYNGKCINRTIPFPRFI